MNDLNAIPRPVAVKWMIGIAWLRLVFFGLIVVLAFYFLDRPEGQWAEGFRRGWIERAGFVPESYGPEQAGATIGGAFIPAVLAGLTLVFTRKRRLIALRIVAALLLLFSLAQPLSLPLAMLSLVLAFRRSTAQYCLGVPGAVADTA